MTQDQGAVMSSKPPSKELCLALAKFWENKNPQRSWEYLICWGFYEMYVEGWWQK